tara:strand:- start:1626 stop:1841 length:216 start_codon:yes stop_codon:yes gene_type:complete
MSPRHPATSPTHPAAEILAFSLLGHGGPGRALDPFSIVKMKKFKVFNPALIVANYSTLLTRALTEIEIKMS